MAWLAASALLVAGQAAWLSIGVWDNIRHPRANRDDVAAVLALEALKDWPELRAELAWRRVTNLRAIRLLFGAIVLAELVVALMLWLSAMALVGVLVGCVAADCAQALAILATAGFAALWLGFLIGGQWFYYWYGAYGQKSHFLCLLWGLATLLVVGAA